MSAHSQSDLSWDNMINGIFSQTEEIRESPYRIFSKISSVLKEISMPSKIYLVGCGDSWVSGLCAQYAFKAWTDISVEVVEALDFVGYEHLSAPNTSLLVAISISGKVSSTIKAVKIASQKGIITIGATANVKSELSKSVDYLIDFDYSENRFSPGTISYTYSLLFLYCFALYLANRTKKMNKNEVYTWLNEISGVSSSVKSTINVISPFLQEFGKNTTLDQTPIFIGSGPNYGTAIYGMIKVIETAGIPARSQHLEEWAHQDFFVTNKNTIVFVISPPDENIERAREQIWAANQMGSTTIAICSKGDTITASASTYALPICESPNLLLSPLVYCLPIQLFAYYLAVSKNLTMLSYNNPKIKEINQKQIYLKI